MPQGYHLAVDAAVAAVHDGDGASILITGFWHDVHKGTDGEHGGQACSCIPSPRLPLFRRVDAVKADGHGLR